MRNILNISVICLILSSCNDTDDKNYMTISKEEYNTLKNIEQQKTFTVGNQTYKIFTSSDSCEYYSAEISAGRYIVETQYFHYPQCSFCNKKK